VADNALTNANKTANTANSTATTANNTANAIKNNIYYTGTTLIDGGKIYTNSIKADAIDVTNLFAQEITANNMNIDGGSVAGWDIVGKILKVTSGGATSYWVLGTDITGSDSGTGAINFSLTQKKIGPGIKTTQLSTSGTDFTVAGTNVSYDLDGVTVTNSNGSKNVMAFTPDSVYIPKLSVGEVHSNGTSYFNTVRANTIKTGAGADLDAVASEVDAINSKLTRKTYGTDVLSVHNSISNEYLHFFAIEYNDFIIISMKAYTNVAINSTTWTSLISGLPAISWAQPLKVFNSDNQSRSFPDAIYSDGKITLITVSGQKYFNAGENVFISGVVMK
jgi:hypothetical protein